MLKRLTVLLGLAVLLFPVLAFAGGTGEAGTTGGNPNAGKVIYGWKVPAKTITINYYAGQSDPQQYAKWGEAGLKWMKDNLNVELKPVWYATDQVERLNLMLASNDYPEVITSMPPDQAEKWAELGKAKELTAMVDKLGPNIKSQLGTTLKRYFDANGKLYVLPSQWGYLPIPDYSASIRYDIWKQIGSPKFETTEEYYQVLKAMVKAYPVNDNNEKVYAMSDYGGGTALWKTLAGAFGIKDQFKEDANNNLTHWMNTPEGLEMARYMNRFYREGLLDPDFAINQYEDWKTKYSASRIMGSIGSWWIVWNAGHEVWTQTVKNYNPDMRGVQVKIRAPSSQNVYFSPKDTTGATRTIMTDKSTQPENIVTYWNWEITDLATKILWWGPPGPGGSWDLKNGQSIWHDDFIEGFKTAGYVGGQKVYDWEPMQEGVAKMVTGQQLMKNGDPRTGQWVTNWTDQNFNDILYWNKVMQDNLKGTVYDNTFRQVTFAPNDPVTVANQQVSDLLKTGWAKMVQAKDDTELQGLFFDLRDQLNKAGLKDVEKFRTAEYKKKLQAWK